MICRVTIVMLVSLTSLPSTAQVTGWLPTGGPESSHIPALAEGGQGELIAPDLNGGLFRSTDFGSSWTMIGLRDLAVRSVLLTPSGSIIAGTTTGDVYFSSGQDTTWDSSSPPGIFDIYSLALTDSGSLFASGNGGICRSDDGGLSWVQLDLGMPQIMIWSTTLAVGGDTVITGSLGMGALRSTDLGGTWDQILPGSPDNIVYRFIRHIDGRIFAATALGLYQTDDLGRTWSEVPDPGNSDLRDFAIDQSGNYVVATGTIPYRSTDEGLSWTPMGSGLNDQTIVSLLAGSNGTVYGGTNGDGVYSASTTTGVSWSPVQPGKFVLARAYPNPFNPAVTIEIRTAERSEILLSIHDVTGRLLERLVESAGTPGLHRFRWDGTGYPSGTYIYQVRVGSSRQAGKLLLLR